MNKDLLKSRVVYALINEDKKEVYIGQTERDALTRLGEHLSTYSTVRKYIETNEGSPLEMRIVFQYQRKHKDIKQRLENKETHFIKHFAKLGYTLINQKKVKNI